MKPDNDFLREYLIDAREEMKWRRDFEFRLLQFLLLFYPVIGTAMVTLYQSTITPQVYLILSVGASLFILLTAILVVYRINVEHKSYADLGKTVQKIWTHFKLFEQGAYLKDDAILPDILRDPQKGFGQGQGYKRTLWLMWIITVAIMALILSLGILKIL
ncbi:MAG: hypothetical protein WA821_22745 [Anaerolineales bacterium]